MCRICVEWELGKLTNSEARRNLGETVSGTKGKDKNHLLDLLDKIDQAELDESDPFDDIWHHHAAQQED